MKDEYWHINPEGDGMAGPFATIEDAKADAMTFLHEDRWHVQKVKIVKTVSTSETAVTFATTWDNNDA